MTVALVLFVILLIVSVVWALGDSLAGGAVIFLAGTVVLCICWALIAGPVSSFQKDKCQTKAEGYGLERSDWSVRFKCRVYLPGGQLVPEDRIRITVDGQIIVGDSDDG